MNRDITSLPLLWPLYLLLLLGPMDVQSQEVYTINGYIEDEETGERLIQANVYDLRSEQGTVSNTYGFFSISLKGGPVELAVSYVGYQTKYVPLRLNRDTLINVTLGSSVALGTVEVVADSVGSRIEEQSQMSMMEVPIAQIKKIPALMGEVDVLKTLQLLPGVQSGGEGQSGLYVRGGSPDQNLVLLDGVPVYNSSHLFGFFSVFNADAIKDVKLIKGGFPARYGGRLSSVIDISMKDGHKDEYHGNVSLGLISSKISFEGPLVKDKTTFLVSARRTYLDLLTKPFIGQSYSDSGYSGDFGYYFYDWNAKVTHKFSDRDRLFVSAYNGLDKFYFEEQYTSDNYKDDIKTHLKWGNTIVATRWNHLWTPKLFSNTTLTYSKYRLGTSIGYSSESNSTYSKTNLEYISGIRDFAGRIDFDYVPNTNHYMKTGLNVIQHNFYPGSFDLYSQDGSSGYVLDTVLGQSVQKAIEYALYIEDDFAITDRLKVNYGLHYSGFFVGKTHYPSLQPRIGLRYLLNEGLALKASYAEMKQYVQLLSYSGIGVPTDLWLPATEKVRPQYSRQIALGLAKTIDRTYELSIEGYYKTMDNVLAYKEGASFFQLNDWQDRVTQGQGESYGLELFLQKKLGRWTGWLGYTLSWSFRQFDDINRGKRYPYRYDRRHDISIVGLYELSEKVHLNATWVYGTGNAVTLSGTEYQPGVPGTFDSGYYYDPIAYNPSRNNFRMNSFHRLDIGVDLIKKGNGYTRKWSLGAYNAYNRKNPFFLFYDTEYLGQNQTKTVLKQASLFPIIPYITYNLEF